MVVDPRAHNIDAILTGETLFVSFTKRMAIWHKDNLTDI
jgi:hypothetical protein